ncbi:MAG: hypothetical protein R2712_18345 [Vicinamibacterales bacterium]
MAQITHRHWREYRDIETLVAAGIAAPVPDGSPTTEPAPVASAGAIPPDASLG